MFWSPCSVSGHVTTSCYVVGSWVAGNVECLLAKQLSSYGYVGIEHSTVLYGESFWCKRRKSCIRLVIQEVPASAAFLWKATVSHRLVQKCPPLQGYSNYSQHWLEHFGSVSSQFMAGSLLWVDTMWFTTSFSLQDHPAATLGGRELRSSSMFLYAVLICIGCESIWLHFWALPSCSLIAPVSLVVVNV